MAVPDLIARLDLVMAELRAIRAEVVASTREAASPEAAASANGLDQADDFADANLIDPTSASARFGYPPDSIRKWCREENLGVRRGGRWLASIPRLHRRLNGR